MRDEKFLQLSNELLTYERCGDRPLLRGRRSLPLDSCGGCRELLKMRESLLKTTDELSESHHQLLLCLLLFG